ncbi:MAG TPA: hypothetical protein VK851_14350 [Anaerolineales bacterium]|nr:hypothetical protein [Anaerolineales bacterium]
MMKKILTPVLLLLVITSACLPVAPPVDSAPQVDSQATIDSIVKTAAAQTLAAQPSPSPTTVPITDTATPTETPTHMTVTTTDTPAPNLTTTPATATAGTQNLTASATLPSSSGNPTLTPTLGILKYGTLPPAVPSADITLINKSNAQAYISLQNYPKNREVAIIEYPVEKQVKIKAPLGYYLYVVWVGGRKIVGEFVLHGNDDLKITIYKDRVTVQ